MLALAAVNTGIFVDYCTHSGRMPRMSLQDARALHQRYFTSGFTLLLAEGVEYIKYTDWCSRAWPVRRGCT